MLIVELWIYHGRRRLAVSPSQRFFGHLLLRRISVHIGILYYIAISTSWLISLLFYFTLYYLSRASASVRKPHIDRPLSKDKQRVVETLIYVIDTRHISSLTKQLIYFLPLNNDISVVVVRLWFSLQIG